MLQGTSCWLCYIGSINACVCVKAKEVNESRRRRLAELQLQANTLQATGLQMKAKEAELKSSLVNINIWLLPTSLCSVNVMC